MSLLVVFLRIHLVYGDLSDSGVLVNKTILSSIIVLRTPDSHFAEPEAVLEKCNSAGLIVNFSKCEFL